MDGKIFEEMILKIIERDSRYAPPAYVFINDSVSFTIHKLERSELAPGQRHISPLEVVNGVLEYASQEFGALSGKVMEYWNIRNGSDIGNIIFHMISAGILTASPEDTLEAFDCFSGIPAFLDSVQQEALKPDSPFDCPPKIS